MEYWTISDACRCLDTEEERRSTVFSLMLGAYYGDDAARQAIDQQEHSHDEIKTHELLKRKTKEKDKVWGSSISQNMSLFMSQMNNSIIADRSQVSTEGFVKTFPIGTLKKSPVETIAAITPQAFLLSCCSEDQTAIVVSESMKDLDQKYKSCAYFYISILKALINGARIEDLNASLRAEANYKNPEAKEDAFKKHVLNVVLTLFNPDNKNKSVALSEHSEQNIATLIVMVLYFMEDIKHGNKWQTCVQLQRKMLMLILKHKKDQCAYNTIVGAVIGALVGDVSMLEITKENCQMIQQSTKSIDGSNDYQIFIFFAGTRFWSFLCAPMIQSAENTLPPSHEKIIYLLDFLFEKSTRVYPNYNAQQIDDISKIIVANIVPSAEKVMNLLKDKNNKKALIGGLYDSKKPGEFSEFCLQLCRHRFRTTRAPQIFSYALRTDQKQDQLEDFLKNLDKADKEEQQEITNEINRKCLDFLQTKATVKDPVQCNPEFLDPRSGLLRILLDGKSKGVDLWSSDKEKKSEIFVEPGTVQIKINLVRTNTIDYTKFYKITGVRLFDNPSCFTEIFIDLRMMYDMQDKHQVAKFLNEFKNVTRMQKFLNTSNNTADARTIKDIVEKLRNEDFLRFADGPYQIEWRLREQHDLVRDALQKKRKALESQVSTPGSEQNNFGELFFVLGSLCTYRLFDCKNGRKVMERLDDKKLKMLYDALQEYHRMVSENMSEIVSSKDSEVFSCLPFWELPKQSLARMKRRQNSAKAENRKTIEKTFDDELLKYPKNMFATLAREEHIKLLLEITKENNPEDQSQNNPRKVWFDIAAEFWKLREQGATLQTNNIHLQEAVARFIINPNQVQSIVEKWNMTSAENKWTIGSILSIIFVSIICCVAIVFIYYFAKFLLF